MHSRAYLSLSKSRAQFSVPQQGPSCGNSDGCERSPLRVAIMCSQKNFILCYFMEADFIAYGAGPLSWDPCKITENVSPQKVCPRWGLYNEPTCIFQLPEIAEICRRQDRRGHYQFCITAKKRCCFSSGFPFAMRQESSFWNTLISLSGNTVRAPLGSLSLVVQFTHTTLLIYKIVYYYTSLHKYLVR